MNKAVLNSIGKVAGAGNAESILRPSISNQQPTIADLVLPGTGYRFSDEFACLLKLLGGESA